MKRLLSGWSVSNSPRIDLTVAQLRDENPDVSVSLHPSRSLSGSLSRSPSLKDTDLNGTIYMGRDKPACFMPSWCWNRASRKALRPNGPQSHVRICVVNH